MHTFITRDGLPLAAFLAEGRTPEVDDYGAEIASDRLAAVDRDQQGGSDLSPASGGVTVKAVDLVLTGDELASLYTVRASAPA